MVALSEGGRCVSVGAPGGPACCGSALLAGWHFRAWFNLISSLSVLDNAALPLLYRGWRQLMRAAQNLAVLETLGIADKGGATAG